MVCVVNMMCSMIFVVFCWKRSRWEGPELRESVLVNGRLMVCHFWGCVEERNRKQKVRDDRNCCRQPRQEATAAGHIPLPTMPLPQDRTAAFPRICFVSVSVFVIVFSDVFWWMNVCTAFLNAMCCIVLFSSKVMSSCNFGPHNATLSSYTLPSHSMKVQLECAQSIQSKFIFLIFVWM